jgi:hypothetical protein
MLHHIIIGTHRSNPSIAVKPTEDDSRSAPPSDFARGQRADTRHHRVYGDFATRMPSTSEPRATGDFASRLDMSSRQTTIADFATGMRTASLRSTPDEPARADNELPRAA